MLKKIILTDKVSATMKVRVIYINSSLAEVECVCITENLKHIFSMSFRNLQLENILLIKVIIAQYYNITIILLKIRIIKFLKTIRGEVISSKVPTRSLYST